MNTALNRSHNKIQVFIVVIPSTFPHDYLMQSILTKLAVRPDEEGLRPKMTLLEYSTTVAGGITSPFFLPLADQTLPTAKDSVTDG